MNFHLVTLFPEVCKPYFEQSILGRAVERGVVQVHYHNPIDKVEPLKRVDDKPYGGGPGMVLQAEPFFDCIRDIQEKAGKTKFVFLTPGGEQFTQNHAKEYATYDDVVLLCGRYEGIDDRVAEAVSADRIAVGEATLTGGELPAMAIADAVSREIPDVVGNENSLEDARISSRKVYTRPETVEFGGSSYTVPEVLRSGHHAKIDDFREGGNGE